MRWWKERRKKCENDHKANDDDVRDVNLICETQKWNFFVTNWDFNKKKWDFYGKIIFLKKISIILKFLLFFFVLMVFARFLVIFHHFSKVLKLFGVFWSNQVSKLSFNKNFSVIS